MHVHVPFSMQDITQCKEQLGSYSENPQKFNNEFECLSLNFSLTWRDIKVILTRCCNDGKKARILDQARKVADERQRVDDSLAPAEEAIPSTEPDWDPNTRAGKESLRHRITCLLQRMTQGVRKVVNYNKIKEVTQEENENPALFLGRLTEVFKNFTKADLKSMEGRVLLAHSFITQAVPDIRRKLQKLGKGPETPISDMVEEANRVFLNRDREEEARREQKEVRKDRKIERETQALAQQQAKMLALINPATNARVPGRARKKKDLNNPPQLSVPTAERMGIGKGSVHIALREGVWRPLHLLPLR